MKVRELQEKLSKLDPELEVFGITEDDALVAKWRGPRLLDIHTVSTTEGETMRADDHAPLLKLGKSPTSRMLVMLEVTADF